MRRGSLHPSRDACDGFACDDPVRNVDDDAEAVEANRDKHMRQHALLSVRGDVHAWEFRCKKCETKRGADRSAAKEAGGRAREAARGERDGDADWRAITGHSEDCVD